MGTNGRNGYSRNVVVVQLSGGNDALNTVIPYTNGLYYQFRPQVNIADDRVLPLDDNLGLNPSMAAMKGLWDDGKLAIVNGIGYPNPNRSHFRSMDVWHTAESEKIGEEGWLGQAIRDLDPNSENVLTGVNFGRGLPRSLYAKMYGGESRDNVAQFIRQTGTDALKGADILRSAPQQYSSSIEYADNPIAQNMKAIAQVMTADLGTRVYYTLHGSFDTHAGELSAHSKLWDDVSGAIGDFMDDLEEQGLADDTVVLMYSEFGRRIRDNGAGTDHGSGGTAFVLGGAVKGGLYGEFPSLDEDKQLEGDMHFNNDFRSTYSTILDRWLGLDPVPITNGAYEQFDFIAK